MEFLYLLEKIRTPFGDTLMQLLTDLGSETPFLIVAPVFFWCGNKLDGYYLMASGFLGTLTTQVLKLTCRIPRPWVRDPDFTIVESAREGASGYSFPSGHSQNAVGTFGAVAICNPNKILRWVCIAIAVIVPFSRMYLGVHTPADVLIGSAIALFYLAVMRPVCYSKNGRYIPALFLGMILLALAFVAYTELFPFPADIDPHNLASAIKNAYTLLGALLGMSIVYFVDKMYIHFDSKAVWYSQILKVVGGLVLALAVKEGLRAPLEALFNGHIISRAVRYMLLVLSAGILWPMTFPWFQKMGRKDP